MKRWLFILAATLLYLAGQAQPYGNEWIEDFDQRYLKMAVTSEGIYRIEYTTLKQSLLGIGVDADALDPRNFQVFGRGEELYIHVENGGAVDSFDPGDFVEFYAEGNDGWLDDRMFVAPNVPANPYHSLINDTATYYFTWNNSVNNRRLNLQGYTNLNQSASQFFLREEVGFWASRYFRGALGPFGKADPEYVSGEGWFSGEFGTPSAPNSVNRSLATGEVFTGASAPAAQIAMVYTGISNASVVGLNHQISLAFSTTPGGALNVLNSLQYNGYELRQDSFSLSAAQLGPATTTFHFITPSGAFTDKSAASHVYLKYPHTYNLEGRSALSMILPSTNGSFTFINASNFNGNNSPVFYDLTGHSRISTDPSAPSGTFRVNVPGGGERQCYVSATDAITTIAATNLQPVGTNGRFFNFSTLDPDSAFVIVSHPRVISGAQDYANYRQSTGYDVVLANIEDLYHQFGYGITKHPLAIRGFADFILDTWTTPAQYLFLIGKSINPEDSRNSTVNHSNNLVPTMGIPSSDNRITARLNGNLFAPAIATGRLSAQTNTDVTIYLDKVQAFETLLNSAPNTESERLWMKRILNFGGGQTQGEQVAFRNFLGNYETILSDTNFGGFASSFFKTTSNPVQVTVSDTIKTLLREGTAIMNFFGHAGGNTFDISIDDPEDWDNQNRYPFLVANSCFAGDIHKPVANVGSTSEEYVLVPNRGVIAFLSSVDLGFPTSLDNYTNALYRHISSIDYGAPIGRQMQFAVQDIQSNDLIVKSTALEFTLHGDPALSVYSFPLPDFVVSEERVLVSPGNVTTALDSFDLQVVITNLGRGVDKPFQVKVTREFPNNSTPQAVSKVVIGIQFRDTVNFRFPVDPINGVGINTFTIEVDPPVPVPQINERDNFFNNRTTKTVVISSDELFPIFPYDFAVGPTSNVTLKASTGDPFAPLRTYRFEIDTTDLFNNPQQMELTQTGGVLNWTPNLQAFGLQDSMVFFWRTAPIPEPGEAFKWREHSFQYIPARNGWSQDHFFQFEDNAYNAIQHNRANRQFDFTPTVGEVRCVVLGNPTNQLEITESHYRLNGNIEEESFCQSVNRPGMNIVVLDSVTLRPWGTYWIDNSEAPPVVFNEDHQFGNVLNLGPGPSCNRDRVQFYFAYHLDDPVQMDSMISLITSRVPKGNYILAYTTGRGRFQDPNVWQPQQFQAFKDLGAQIIETVNDSVPYIFFTKAGYPGSAQEVIGTVPFERIQFDTVITSSLDLGLITSPVIGPARSWESLHWEQRPQEANSTDSVALNVWGLRNRTAGAELLFTLDKQQTDIANLANQVDVNTYPYLQLQLFNQDQQAQTPAQLDRWQVLFEGVPEAAVSPPLGFTFHADTLEQGDVLSMALAVQNVSDYDLDSLRVQYWLEDTRNEVIPIPYAKQDSLRAGGILLDTLNYDTRDLSGTYTLWMEVNPQDSLWQREQFHFNNLATQRFFVNRDNANPLLDVTFDGIRILDGDIVSPEPFIVIDLKDENEFLPLNDTANFKVFLRDPDGIERRIYFISNGQENMRFTPGTINRNRANIEYRPQLTKNGLHELRIQAYDVSKNQSGDIDYTISFEVVRESTITQVLNYPNPFSTSTRFVFTLTGSRVPDYMLIQILTVTGKVVREITQEELGSIRIGRNITDYAWDGRDDYGDELANGVYLYRVITRLDGELIEHRNSGADPFFKRNFGKMYLMR